MPLIIASNGSFDVFVQFDHRNHDDAGKDTVTDVSEEGYPNDVGVVSYQVGCEQNRYDRDANDEPE
jgi:hypothetical protein